MIHRKIRVRPLSLAGIAVCMIAPTLHAAAPAEIVIPGERIFPESLTSTSDGTVIIGSIGAATIFRAAPGAANATSWIQSPADGQGVFGVFADEKADTLWACTGAFGTPGAPPPAPAALHAFDLQTGKHKARYQVPTAGGFCNDIAIGPDGAAYATDTSNMELLRLPKGGTQLEVWAGNGAFGPKGGVLDGVAVLGDRVLVNTLATSRLFNVPIGSDGKAGTVTEVTLDQPMQRPDGMRSHGKDGLLVAEGGSGGRLTHIAVHGDTGKLTVVKQGYPDGPVAVTVVGDTAYVLEGQLAARRAPPAENAQPKPFRATAVSIKP